MEVDDFFERHYFFELDRKDKYSKSVAQAMTLITIMSGALITMCASFFGTFFPELLFAVAAVITSLFILKALYFSVKAHHDFSYSLVPSATDALVTFEALTSSGKRRNETKAWALLRIQLRERYATANAHNRKMNNKKGEFLFQTNRALVIALCPLLVCGVLFVARTYVNNNLKVFQALFDFFYNHFA